jgi:prolipoprotein diacylglyceryl transferase
MIASIPSPSSGALSIGPLSIHAYGLMIALGVIAAVWLTGKRLEKSGAGTREDASSMAVWAVIAGVIGARLYHVVTDWDEFKNDLGRIPQIWRGGLGIPGGILFGALAAMWAFKRRGIAPAVGLSAAAPALPLAQAIGRWGNWWNQELFGKATTLPWGLRIDANHLPVGYSPGTTFHPTFLYESLWNLALVVVLLRIDRKFTLRPGRLFAMYIVGYATGRFWVEGLRIDPAHTAGGLRLNQWVALIVGLLALLYLVFDWSRHRDQLVLEPDFDADLESDFDPDPDPDADRVFDPGLDLDLDPDLDPDPDPDLDLDLDPLDEDVDDEAELTDEQESEAPEPDLRESLD